jgi:glycosyltransferase involved in cell wall biosynthesis
MISILLSSYNGEKYIKYQLDSILSQTFEDWNLYIRDDGSTDSTLSIINTYQSILPSKIKIVNDGLGNIKSAKSFMMLLRAVDSEYYMFCDQDDVWLPNKIEESFKALKKIEKDCLNKPLMVFTDLAIVDRHLSTIHDSMWKYAGINPSLANDFYQVSVATKVTGSTMIFNKHLRDLSLPLPQYLVMHDWWLSLIVSRMGVVSFLTMPTVLYRQHDSNVLGAEKHYSSNIISKIVSFRTVIINNYFIYRMLKELPFKFSSSLYFYQKVKRFLINS